MILTTPDALTKAALLVAAVAISNLQWAIAVNSDAPALFYVGSMVGYAALTPIVAIIPGALFFGVVALTVVNRTPDHARVCFLMGLYVVALCFVSSNILRITDIPKAPHDKNGVIYWFFLYAFAFYWSWPNVRMAKSQQEIQQEIDKAAQRAGGNRWLFVGGCFLLFFVMLFAIQILGEDFRFALYFSGASAALCTVVIGFAAFVSDALQGQLRFWKLPRRASRIRVIPKIRVDKFDRKKKEFEKQTNREELKQQFITQKNWRALVRFSQEWAAAEPLSFSALCSLGLACGHLGEHAAARDAFIAALRVNRDNAEAWFNLGLAHEQLKDNQKALTAYQHAVRCNPDYREAAERLQAMHGKSQNQSGSGSRSQSSNSEEVQKRHFAFIRAAHPDFDAIVDLIPGWIAKQPAPLRPALEKVYRIGTPSEVIDLITEYKRSLKQTEPRRWYEVLGVAQGASFDEVKAAYRKLMQDYHPDRVASLGKELRDLAERKAKEINEAFRDFEKVRQR